MNPAELLAKLGITGIDPSKVSAAIELAQTLGGSIDMPMEEYLPDVDEKSFYLPKAGGSFYYDSDTFRKLHAIDHKGLRSLVTPNLSKLRRLQNG